MGSSGKSASSSSSEEGHDDNLLPKPTTPEFFFGNKTSSYLFSGPRRTADCFCLLLGSCDTFKMVGFALSRSDLCIVKVVSARVEKSSWWIVKVKSLSITKLETTRVLWRESGCLCACIRIKLDVDKVRSDDFTAGCHCRPSAKSPPTSWELDFTLTHRP